MEEENALYQCSLILSMFLCFIIPVATLYAGFKLFPADSIYPPILSIVSLFIVLIGMCIVAFVHDQPQKKKESKKRD